MAKKSKKEIIVAASGYFDPLHAGHIEYLALSKKLGNKLIVILNNDEQAILNKGFIFMPIKERIKILKSLRYVDEIFVSIDKDKSVNKSLEVINPDIFTNGGNKFNNRVPEAKICKKLGIKMVDKLGEKIQSSSELAKRFIG